MLDIDYIIAIISYFVEACKSYLRRIDQGFAAHRSRKTASWINLLIAAIISLFDNSWISTWQLLEYRQIIWLFRGFIVLGGDFTSPIVICYSSHRQRYYIYNTILGYNCWNEEQKNYIMSQKDYVMKCFKKKKKSL